MAPCLITSSIKSTMSVEARPEVEQVCDPNRKQVSCAVLHKEKITAFVRLELEAGAGVV